MSAAAVGLSGDAGGWRLAKERRCDKERSSDRFFADEVDATEMHDAA
jgi:hypothetical protein